MNNLAPTTEGDPEIDPRAFRDALGCFATGVTIVTTLGPGEEKVGLTVNSFSSVSLDPPLILWSLQLNAASLKAFRLCDGFAVNILAADQKDICMNFAKPREDKFEGIACTAGVGGIPLIDGAFVQFECRTEARFPGGDHEVYVGRVLNINVEDKDPLVYFRGGFADLTPQPRS